MIRLPQRHLIAIEAVLDIAHHGGAAPVRGAEIADRLGVPRRSLEHRLQALVRAGILLAQRGPRGGYRLARERRRIAVGEIVRALEGDDEPAEVASPAPTSDLGRAVIAPMAEAAERVLHRHLDTLTIETLCQQARERGVRSAHAEPSDFTI